MNSRNLKKALSRGTRGYYRVFAHRRKLRVNIDLCADRHLRKYPANLASSSPHFLLTHTPRSITDSFSDNSVVSTPQRRSQTDENAHDTAATPSPVKTSVIAHICSLFKNRAPSTQ